MYKPIIFVKQKMSVLLSLFTFGVSLWINFCRVTATTVEYKYVNESMVWRNAVTYCDIVLNGSLADGNVSSLPAINESTSGFWVGRYSAYTDWTWITGCFRYSIIQGVTPITITLNNVVNCQNSCNTTYVALRETSCHCLQARPDDTNGSPSCNAVCAGNSKELCGGVDAVSVYEKDVSGSSKFAIIPRQGNQLCGSISTTEESILYFQRDCTMGFGVACKIFTSTANTFELIPLGGYSSWEKSNSYCRTYNGSLADIKSSAQFTSFLSDNLHGDIWIGAYRLQNTFTLQEKVPNVTSLITCSYYNQGQIIDKTIQECQTEIRPFFCRIERPSDTATSTSTGNSSGTIAGVVIVILLTIAVILIIVIVLYRSKRKRKILESAKSSRNQLKEDKPPQLIESTYADADTLNSSDFYAKNEKDDVIYQETEEGSYNVLNERREHARNNNHHDVYYDHTGKGIYSDVGEAGNDMNYKPNHNAPGQINIQTDNVYEHTDTIDKPNHVSTNKQQHDLNLTEHIYSETET